VNNPVAPSEGLGSTKGSAAFTEAGALTKIIHAVVKHGDDVGSSFVFFERKNIAVGFPSVALTENTLQVDSL